MELADPTQAIFTELFSDEGLLAKALSVYEHRLDQQKMTEKIWSAFEKEENALFEAGTGIGKSLAYLIPALLWSSQTKETVVISTYTISLQQQLIEKDIPFLLDLLGLDLSVVLAKGMGNYVCIRKLDELSHRGNLMEEGKTYDALLSWAHGTGDGSKSALPFSVAPDIWREVKAESDSCSHMKCPHYNRCFFFKARSLRQDAHVIVVNHHLLMADLLADENQSVLPPFSRLIVDEAHHLEPVARSCSAQTVDRVALFRSMARVHSDTHPEVSRFVFLSSLLKEMADESLKQRLKMDLPGEKRDLIRQINEVFDLLDQSAFGEGRETKWRITGAVLRSKFWQDDLSPAFAGVREAMKRYAASLDSLRAEVEDMPLADKEKVASENALLDLSSVASELKKTVHTLELFFSDEEDTNVRWMEKTVTGTCLTLAKLDMAAFLEEKLFGSLKTAILCSATLTVEENFAHVCNRLGVGESAPVQEVYPSPFDFKERTRLMGFSDLPAPNSYDFIPEITKVISEAVSISGGGAFVLFTSYDMLHKCGNQLEDRLDGSGMPLFKQGDLSRHLLLEEFKRAGNGVLLGADSFWEGVDVPGDALRLVIIVKLPFPVPSDPLLEARAELLKKEGKDAFWEDSVPQAVMKFKQGFGRLMRRKDDRGCVLCLDQRLFNRQYGKIFLRSLPECITSFQPREKIFEEMGRFYR